MAIRLVPFKIESLRHLDGGRPAAMVEHDLANAIRDCYERPGDSRVRTVSVKITVRPQIDPISGLCETVKFFIESNVGTPRRSTKEYEGSIKPNGTMRFALDTPDAVDQHSLLPVDDDDSPPDGKSQAAGE